MILDLLQLKDKYSMNITGVIHIGAHFGEEHAIYKSLNIDNVVYFEPVKKTFEVLKNRITDAELHNVALGNDNKFIEMYIEEADAYGCSSILPPSSNYNGVKFSENEVVEMKKLDDYNFTKFNFLNIDVQGYEFQVLKGAHNTLNYVNYIMCEINRVTEQKSLDYIGASTIDEIEDYLSQYGFILVQQNWAGISWGDGFFIKCK